MTEIMKKEMLLAREAEDQNRISDALQHLLNSINFFHLFNKDGKKTTIEEIKKIYREHNRYLFYFSVEFIVNLL